MIGIPLIGEREILVADISCVSHLKKPFERQTGNWA